MVERWCEVGGRPQEERDRDGGESARRGVVERVCEASDGCEFAAREQPGQRGRPFSGHDAITLPADDERGYVDLRHSGFDGVTQPGDEGLDRCTDSAMQVALKRLEAVVISNRDVVAVLAGHLHSAMSSTFADRPLVVAPGVSTTAVLPWEESETSMHSAEPPGVAFHVVTEHQVVTHFRTAQPRA